MKKTTLIKSILFTVSLSLLTGCGNQPQTFVDSLRGKTAQESVTLAIKETKFPVTYKNGTILENVAVDSNDDTIAVWTFKTTLVPKQGKEDFFIDQEGSLTDKVSRKNILHNCKKLYSYYQNGAKLKNIFKWKTGKVYQEYIISKEVCDSLN